MHLMPIVRHAYYMKDDPVFSEPVSAREEIVADTADFYKGA